VTLQAITFVGSYCYTPIDFRRTLDPEFVEIFVEHGAVAELAPPATRHATKPPLLQLLYEERWTAAVNWLSFPIYYLI
jgi:hypothetical protein